MASSPPPNSAAAGDDEGGAAAEPEVAAAATKGYRVRDYQNPDAGAALWRSYKTVGESWKNFAMKRISKPADIYPVFRELFEKRREPA